MVRGTALPLISEYLILYHITPLHIAKASVAGSVTGGWAFPTLATVFLLIAKNNLAPIASNQYHMNLSTLAGK